MVNSQWSSYNKILVLRVVIKYKYATLKQKQHLIVKVYSKS